MLLFTTGCKISSDNKDPVELPDNQYKEHFCGMCMYCWKTEDDHVCDRLLENVEPSVVIKNYYKDKNAELTTYRSIVGEKYQTQYREFTYYDSGYLKTAAFTDEHTVPDNNDLTVTFEFTDCCSAKTPEIASANINDMRNMGIECISFEELQKSIYC